MDITLVLVTLLSLALAAVMTTLAWRLAREERRRSEARVAALASEIRRDDLPLRESRPVVQTADLFTSAQRSTSSPLRALGLAIVAVVALGVLSYAAFGLSRGRQTATTPAADPKSAASTATRPADVPLELTALTHERDGNRLTVRGIVRNPPGSPGVKGLVAVVFLFDKTGGFVTSGRAPIDPLPSGAESPFSVTVANVSDVGRYRVSFRTDDRVVPHVDRRDRPVAQVK